MNHALIILNKISNQLANIHYQQQEGFNELCFRHDTLVIKATAAIEEAEANFLAHFRVPREIK